MPLGAVPCGVRWCMGSPRLPWQHRWQGAMSPRSPANLLAALGLDLLCDRGPVAAPYVHKSPQLGVLLRGTEDMTAVKPGGRTNEVGDPSEYSHLASKHTAVASQRGMPRPRAGLRGRARPADTDRAIRSEAEASFWEATYMQSTYG